MPSKKSKGSAHKAPSGRYEGRYPNILYKAVAKQRLCDEFPEFRPLTTNSFLLESIDDDFADDVLSVALQQTNPDETPTPSGTSIGDCLADTDEFMCAGGIARAEYPTGSDDDETMQKARNEGSSEIVTEQPIKPQYTQQRTKEWYEFRKGKITASVVFRFLGLSSKVFSTMTDFKYDTDQTISELLSSFAMGVDPIHTQDPPFTRSWLNKIWGTLHEYAAIYDYLKAVKVTQGKISSNMPPSWVESGMWLLTEERYNEVMDGYRAINGMEIPFSWIPPIGASPDGLYPNIAKPSVCFEIKCRSMFLQKHDFFAFCGYMNNSRYGAGKPFGAIPGYYIPQIQLQMMVTGCERSVFISWTPNNGMNIFFVDYDKSYCQLMLEVLAFNGIYASICNRNNRPVDERVITSHCNCQRLARMTERMKKQHTPLFVPNGLSDEHTIIIPDNNNQLFIEEGHPCIDFFKEEEGLFNVLEGRSDNDE
jgi:hypothetical protein